MNFDIITSRNNPLIKEIAKLSDKKHREKSSLFAFEGRKLLSEALQSGVQIVNIFVTQKALQVVQKMDIPCRLTVVSDEVYDKISFEKSPEGIFCVAKTLDKFHNLYIIDRREDFHQGSYFVLDGIRDPGNLGTILRTASAFGCDCLIMSEDCADIYNPKTVRASMGAIFRQKTLRASDLTAVILNLRECDKTVYAATLDDNSISLFDTKVNSNVCFVVGNEGNGIRSEVIGACNGSVIIPMENGTESLNAAAASTILLYEAYRQR